MAYTLVVAEKPSAGADIAKVLGATNKHDGYLEGNGYLVTWAIGHLIEQKEPDEHDERYQKWSLDEIPFYFDIKDSLKVKKEGRKQFNVIKELIARKDVDLLINAGDAGREGYLIQEWIYRMARCRLPKKVLWASSLTTAGIQQAFRNLKDNDLPEFQGILEEAEARAEGDWILGYNYTRLLTLTRGYRQNLPYGRCQTPLLNLIVKRDDEIAAFKPEPYWEIEAVYTDGFKGILIDADGKNKRYMDKTEASTISSKCSSDMGTVISYTTTHKKIKAPLLYNLAKLQQDMGRKFNYTPEKTLQAAQSLYEKHKMLSYPRTDSQYLSMDVFEEISEHLSCCVFGEFAEKIKKIDLNNIQQDKSYFNDLKVTDHHALIPTINQNMAVEYEKLEADEKNVFCAVVNSLIAIFYPYYEFDATTVIIDIGGESFKSSGTTVKAIGFKEVLNDDKKQKDNADEQLLPVLSEGSKVSVDGIKVLEKITKAPKYYTDETIIKVMEKYDIGTSATRAEIIKKLQAPKRQFIERDKNGNYVSTDLGRQYIRVVPDNLKDSEFTHRFEEQLKQINKGDLDKDVFLSSLALSVAKDKENFVNNPIPDEMKIGYYSKTSEAPGYLGVCPNCGSSVLSGKFGAYCESKCGMTFSKIMGKPISDKDVTKLLKGAPVLVENIESKNGKKYSAIFSPNGIEPYEFEKDGIKRSGFRWRFSMDFPDKTSDRKKKKRTS